MSVDWSSSQSSLGRMHVSTGMFVKTDRAFNACSALRHASCADIFKLSMAARDDSWVLRCVCSSEDETTMFLIQCGTCEVWQHGRCVGVTEEDVPDNFECDLCNPTAYHSRMESEVRRIAKKRGRKSKVELEIIAKRKKMDHSEIDDYTSDTAFSPDMDTRPQSREERKMAAVLRSIELMESREVKRKRSGVDSSSAEAAFLSKKKRRTSVSDKGTILDLTSYIKTREHVKKSFPVSPMYLGKKHWLLGVMAPCKSTSSKSSHEVCFMKRITTRYSKSLVTEE